METGIYEVYFKDGRTYRIFYANKTQKIKMLQDVRKLGDKVKYCEQLTNGIHNTKQWSNIVETFLN